MTDKASDPSPETILTHTGRHPEEHFGFVNTPVYRGSTVLYPTLKSIETGDQRYDYGRIGNPSSEAVEELISTLEGAKGTVLAPSGLSAVTLALMAVLNAGDHLLVTDSAYHPTRKFADGILQRMGIAVEYYDPRTGSEIAGHITPQTKAIFVETPGSLTFDLQDLPAIVAAAKPSGAYVIVDNSWATPLYFKPLALGADIVVHAGTKMFVGHSDAMFGTVSANVRAWAALQRTHRQLGLCASPDDCFLAARGMRTLAIRMAEHSRRSLEIAGWLEGQKGVARVHHPALPSHPEHALFKRDFTGGGSVFGVELTPGSKAALGEALDHFTLFGMGWSWGGYESLCIPAHPEKHRTALDWTTAGPMLRLHIGLEGMDDIKADLAAALARYLAA